MRLAARRLTAAGTWLSDLHAATRRGRLDGAALRERIVRAPLAAYEQAFGQEKAEAGLFDRARRHVDRANGVALPIVIEHGDFGPWNVFRDGRAITVVDWEAARDGPPLCDLLYFVTHWESQLRHGGISEAAQRLAIPLSTPRSDTLAEVTRRQILRYNRRLEIADTLYPLLVLYTFVEQALDRMARLAELGDPGATARAGNPYVACVAALARGAERLFPE